MQNNKKQETFDKWANSMTGCTGILKHGSPIWFCGLEPGGSDSPQDEMKWSPTGNHAEDLLNWDSEKFNPEWGKSQVDSWTAKFLCCYQGETSKWREFKDSHLYRKEDSGLPTVKLNLFPIARPSQGDKAAINRLEDCTGYNLQQYYSASISNRGSLFKNLIAQYKPRSVICFGKSHWPQFIKAFDLPEANKMQLISITGSHRDPLKTNKNGTDFYLTGFFGNGQMSDKIMHAIVDDIKKHS